MSAECVARRLDVRKNTRHDEFYTIYLDYGRPCDHRRLVRTGMTDQGDFSAGGVLQASDLNAFSQVTILRNEFDVPTSTNTSIVFDTELVDVGGWHSGTSSVIQVDVTGIYLITANAINVNASSGRGLLNLFKGSTVIASQDDNNGAHDLSLAAHYPLTSGDQITLQCYQTSGSTKTITFMLSCQLIRKTS